MTDKQTIRFHPARWSFRQELFPGGDYYLKYQRRCVTCGKWVGEITNRTMLSELTLFEAPDGCCYHEHEPEA